ncbi:hypothetical protein GCM10009785_28100 [Brooklawnia cerclae]
MYKSRSKLANAPALYTNFVSRYKQILGHRPTQAKLTEAIIYCCPISAICYIDHDNPFRQPCLKRRKHSFIIRVVYDHEMTGGDPLVE